MPPRAAPSRASSRSERGPTLVTALSQTPPLQTFIDYGELEQDLVVKRHFEHLYKTMIEKDWSRVVQPYSLVKIEYVAGKIKMPVSEVEQHLVEMIDSGKLSGWCSWSFTIRSRGRSWV